MGKIIILEGPDGAGKTTLARKLEKRGFHYEHDGVPPTGRDNIAYYLNILNEAIESDYDYVFDRLWLGERIYGPVARKTDTIEEAGQRLFMRLHNSKSILQLVCLPPLDVLLKNYETKCKDPSDYLQSVEKLTQVHIAYVQWCYKYVQPIFDYTNPAMATWNPVNHIPKTALPRGTVGSKSAKYLFIGDIPNHPSIDVPFHALNGSSGYFNTALRLADIMEQDLAISNARGPFELHSLRSIVRDLPKLEHIFLMGGKAGEWFKREPYQDVEAHYIHHPSFLKRFHGHDPQTMADLIRKELDGQTN